MGLTGKWLSATVLLILAGCQSTAPVQTTGGDGLVGDEFVQQQFIAEPGLSNRQRLREAINQLALGNPGQAEAELRVYMENVSNSKIAKDLLTQIIAPISELYPEEYVEVSLDEGTSLSSIAKQYLGNPLQFYGLARYNAIKEPGKTVIGQVIKVPLTEPVKAKLASLAAGVEETAGSIGDEVDKLEQGAPLLPESITTIETPEYTIGGVELVSVLLADNDYEGAVTEFERLGDNEGFEKDELGRIASAYIVSGDHLITTHPNVASERYFNAGKLMLMLGQKQSALNALISSVEIDDGNRDALILLTSLKTDLTDGYHREASQAFRRQELEIAIELWERVIAIDPDHAHAGSNLMQAQELKEKLGHLE